MTAAYPIVAQALLLHGLKTWWLALFAPLVMGITKKRVAVFPPEGLGRRQATFDSLAEIVPVKFEPFFPETSSLPDACIFLGQSHPFAQQHDIPSYTWERASASSPSSTQVEFSSWSGLHGAIRGQLLSESAPRAISSVPMDEQDTVLASVGGRPVWKVRGASHYVSVDPPCLAAGELLWHHFVPERWLGLLPLLQFLKSVSQDIDWQDPPPSACFIFDDPNLHALRYGYLNFPELAREARERNYHVAIATVPLDSWYVNAHVARLFREQSDYISLTAHGCEHTKYELVGNNGHHLPLLAEALQRVDRLEARAHVQVSRVMVAPHSACSESTMDLMLRLGYEGSCIAAKHLLLWNQNTKWPLNFGLGNILWMGGGFPVSYRLAIAANMQTQICLAAFLGQPVLVYGHHADCAAGLEILGNIADFVNGLGGHWADMTSIMRGSYRARIEDHTLHVQMCSRRIDMRIPEGVTHITVERPWMGDGDSEHLGLSGTHRSSETIVAGRVTAAMAVTSGEEISIRALPKAAVDYKGFAGPRVRVWPVVRRVLVESRDRLQPIMRRKYSRT